MPLTAMQQIFVTEYLTCRNATEAARRAGYGSPIQRGHENMNHPEIKAVIEQSFAASVMTAGEVLALFAEQARAEYAQYIREDRTVDVAQMVRDGKAHLIKSIKHTRTGHVNVEFHDPVAAREIIARVHGLTDRGRTIDEPQHSVQWTVEEWKAEQEKRRKQAAETEADFEDE